RDSLPQLPGDFGPSQTGISPDFFKASGLPLGQGRDFTDGDVLGSQRVAIISESLARLYWPGEAALGQCVMLGQPTASCSIIVGVSADPHRMRIIETTTGQIYYPLTQSTDDPTDLIVRARPGQETAVIRAADQILRPLIGSMDGLWARTFRSIVEPEVRSWRLGATLFTALGVLALIVAAVGGLLGHRIRGGPASERDGDSHRDGRSHVGHRRARPGRRRARTCCGNLTRCRRFSS